MKFIKLIITAIIEGFKLSWNQRNLSSDQLILAELEKRIAECDRGIEKERMEKCINDLNDV